MLDFLHCSIYTGGMRYVLIIMLSLLVTQPVAAQSLSPIEQYMQRETGYYAPASPVVQPAPEQPQVPAQAPAPLPSQPVTSASPSPIQQYIQNEAGYAPQRAAAAPVYAAPAQPTNDSSITAGLSGMNF